MKSYHIGNWSEYNRNFKNSGPVQFTSCLNIENLEQERLARLVGI